MGYSPQGRKESDTTERLHLGPESSKERRLPWGRVVRLPLPVSILDRYGILGQKADLGENSCSE